jgi:hypothetical protein
MCVEEKKDYYSNAFLRQTQDKLAQHDKAREAKAIAISLSVNKVWPFEKVTSRQWHQQCVRHPLPH